MNLKEEMAFLLIMFVIVVVLGISVVNNDKQKIETKIQSINGETIDVSKRLFNENPIWKWTTKNDRVYKIKYKINGIEKIGWVKFGWGESWWLQ